MALTKANLKYGSGLKNRRQLKIRRRILRHDFKTVNKAGGGTNPFFNYNSLYFPLKALVLDTGSIETQTNYVENMAQRAFKSVFSDVDEYGFERPDDFDYESYEVFMSSYIKTLARRSKKWDEMLGDGKVIRKSAKLKRYVRKGIPAERRALVWFKVSGAEELKKNMADDFYTSLLKEDLNAGVVEMIKLDLHRTFPNNIFFKSGAQYQTELFNVLVAYAHQNPKVGYCQGLNYIAGLLLLVTKNEETSFWLLKTLIEHILEDYYSSTMEGLIVDLEVLSELIRSKVPDVHRHVTHLGLPWPVICTKWFVCLFAEVLPTETVLRIWDCVFYEGSKIFFRVGIALMKLNRQQLLECKDYADTVNRCKAMTKDYSVVDCHQFMQSIFTLPGSLSNATILKLRERISREKNFVKQVEP